MEALNRGKKNLKQFAYDDIKEKIIRCEYVPGSLLNENILATELEISRTPIREALNQLHHEGLLQIMPKKGILVSNITIVEMSQIYQIRHELEPFIVRISGPHIEKNLLLETRALFLDDSEEDLYQQLEIDTNFHRYLADNCHNKYAQQLMNKVLDENMRVIISTRNKVRIGKSCDEHIKIIDLMLAEDFEAAANVMRIHVENCRDSAFSYFLNKTTS